jgi:hypothetical protein
VGGEERGRMWVEDNVIRGRMGRMRVEKDVGGCGWETLGCGGVEEMWMERM